MSTIATKDRLTKRKLTIDEMFAQEVAAHDRRVQEIIKEMSQPKKNTKTPKKPK